MRNNGRRNDESSTTPTRRSLSSATAALVALASILAVSVLSGCATRATGVRSAGATLERQIGIASFYGPAFHGRTTASGARFNMRAMTAAHPSYAFGTRVRVTNLANGRTAVVTVNDRGPAGKHTARGIIIDLSYGAAQALDFVQRGLQRVRVEVLSWGDGGYRSASN